MLILHQLFRGRGVYQSRKMLAGSGLCATLAI